MGRKLNWEKARERDQLRREPEPLPIAKVVEEVRPRKRQHNVLHPTLLEMHEFEYGVYKGSSFQIRYLN